MTLSEARCATQFECRVVLDLTYRIAHFARGTRRYRIKRPLHLGGTVSKRKGLAPLRPYTELY